MVKMRRNKRHPYKKSTNIFPILIIGGIILASWVLYNSALSRNILGVSSILQKQFPSPTLQQLQIDSPPTPTNTTVLTQSQVQPVPTTPISQPVDIIISTETKTVPIENLTVNKEIEVLQDETQSQTIIDTTGQTNLQVQPTQTQSPETVETTFKNQEIIQNQTLLSQPLMVQTVDKTETVRVASTDIINLENNNRQLSVNLEDNDGNTKELAFTTFEKVRSRLISDDISVYTSGNKEFLIQTDKVGAVTTFPISVTLTNDIIANTEIGPILIDISGSRVLQYLNDTNTINDVKVKLTNNASINQVVKLIVFDNKLAYQVEGCKKKHLLAFWPVDVCGTVIASAHSENAIYDIYKTPFNNFLDRVSL